MQMEFWRAMHRCFVITLLIGLTSLTGCGKKDDTAALFKKLSDAITKGYLVEVQKLSREHPRLLNLAGNDAMASYPLHLAVNHNRLEIAKTLLENGADINARNKHGQTPLILSAMNGRTEFAELLISRNARKDVRDHWGQSALMYATKRRYPDIAKLVK